MECVACRSFIDALDRVNRDVETITEGRRPTVHALPKASFQRNLVCTYYRSCVPACSDLLGLGWSHCATFERAGCGLDPHAGRWVRMRAGEYVYTPVRNTSWSNLDWLVG